MKVAIRTDASSQIGSGHVMRCLALAAALREIGAHIVFVCREHPGNLCNHIVAQGFQVFRLQTDNPVPERTSEQAPHAQWLGTTWQTDADECLDVLSSNGNWDWLIVDHYALDFRWEGSMRSHVDRIAAIDDLADRRHECDLLIDHNVQSAPGRYDGLVPTNCIKLLGTQFGLLRPEFSVLRATSRPRDGKIRRILIFVGGADPDNFTSTAIEAVQKSALSGIPVDVVVGETSPYLSEIQRACRRYPNHDVYVQTPDIAQLMAKADLAIGASGGTTWERCTLGLPTVFVTIAKNQLEIAQAISSRRAGIYAGWVHQVSATRLAEILTSLSSRPGMLRRIAKRGMSLVDGHGLGRVTAAMGRPLEINLVSDEGSWLSDYLERFVKELQEEGHSVKWLHSPAEIVAGDCTFFLSCSQIAQPAVLAKSAHNLVVHESALPGGRGWSPLTWQVLEGKSNVPITLFEAGTSVDSGQIYLVDMLTYEGHELVDELRRQQARKTIELCRSFVNHYPSIVTKARKQEGVASYYSRRGPEDSRLDPEKPLSHQFNLLRVVDNNRYPAFFEMAGHRYVLQIYKVS